MAKQVQSLVANRDNYSQNIEQQLQNVLNRFPQLRESLPPSLQDADKLKINEVIEASVERDCAVRDFGKLTVLGIPRHITLKKSYRVSAPPELFQ